MLLPQEAQDVPPRVSTPLVDEAAKSSVAALGDRDCDEVGESITGRSLSGERKWVHTELLPSPVRTSRLLELVG